MRTIKRLLAALIAATLVLSLGAVAFATPVTNNVQEEEYGSTDHSIVKEKHDTADPKADIPAADGVIRISNAQAGRTYHLWKIFDAFVKDNGAVYYKLPKGVTSLTSIGLATPIDASNAAGGKEWFYIDSTDTTIGDQIKAVVKDGKYVLDDEAFQEGNNFDGTTPTTPGTFVQWAKSIGTEIMSAEAKPGANSTGTENNVLEFSKLPLGYYLVTVDPIVHDPAEPGDDKPANFKGWISVDTTNKTAEIADKNDNPHWTDEYGKKIADKINPDSPDGSFGVGKEIPYEVKVTSRNTDENGNNIYKYYIYDTTNELMTYTSQPALSIDNVDMPGDAYEIIYYNATYAEIQAWINDPTATHGQTDPAKVTIEQVNAEFRIDPTGKTAQEVRDEAKSFRVEIDWATPAEKFIDNKTEYKDDGTALTAEEIQALIDAHVADPTNIKDPRITGEGRYDKGVTGKEAYAGKTMAEFYAQKYRDGAVISLTYKAMVDPVKVQAAIDRGEDPALFNFQNKAGFGYYNALDDENVWQPREPKEVAPEQDAYNYEVDVVIYKVDEDGKALEGAKFKLSGDGTKYSWVGVPEWSPQTAAELAAGTYTKLWKLKKAAATDPDKYTTDDPTTPLMDLTKYDEYDPALGSANDPTTWTIYKQTGSYVIQADTQTTAQEEAADENHNDFTGDKVKANGNNKARWNGLGDGIYTLVESTTPDGYNTLADRTFRIEFHDEHETGYEDDAKRFEAYEVIKVNNEWVKKENGLVFEYTKGTKTVYDPATGNVVTQGTHGILSATVENRVGGELPATGGIGTTIFYVVGSILLVGAGVVLFTRKRVQE
jgi:LPXTG-motif cell wall-anchored protein